MTLDYSTNLREPQVPINKIPRQQKVVNIKLKDNQFIVPHTTTNKENLNFTQSNLMSKINLAGYSTSRNQTALGNPQIREPLSTKNSNMMPTVTSQTIDTNINHNRIGSTGFIPNSTQSRISLNRVDFSRQLNASKERVQQMMSTTQGGNQSRPNLISRALAKK